MKKNFIFKFSFADEYIAHWQNDTVKCICKLYGICKYIGISSLSL